MGSISSRIAAGAVLGLCFIGGFSVSGCATYSNLESFAQSSPELKLEEYFLGETKAYGVFEDRFNKVRRTFIVDIFGTLENDTLTLEEHFLFDDGETDLRIWTIKVLGNGEYSGFAEGEIDSAEGRAKGNAFNWIYTVPLSEDGMKVKFNDWMFLLEDDVLINRAYVSKWGLRIGEVTISFAKTQNDS